MNTNNGRELPGGHFERVGGPAARSRLEIPTSLLKDPLSDPARYAEIVRPIWDFASDLVERDYASAFQIALQLRQQHLPHAEENRREDLLHVSDRLRLQKAVQMTAEAYGEEATVFESLSVLPLRKSMYLDIVEANQRLYESSRKFENKFEVEQDPPCYACWTADFIYTEPIKGGVLTIRPDSVSYGIAIFQYPHSARNHESIVEGHRTWKQALEDVAAYAPRKYFFYQPEPETVRLRLSVFEHVILLYESEGRVERYDEAASKVNPPEVPHAFKLAEDAAYCVERACNLIREHGLTLRAAHARLVEEVKGEYPAKSPFYPHYDSIKDAFKTRGIRIADLRGENGGSGGRALSA